MKFCCFNFKIPIVWQFIYYVASISIGCICKWKQIFYSVHNSFVFSNSRLEAYPAATGWQKCLWTNSLFVPFWLWTLWNCDWSLWWIRWLLVLFSNYSYFVIIGYRRVSKISLKVLLPYLITVWCWSFHQIFVSFL